MMVRCTGLRLVFGAKNSAYHMTYHFLGAGQRSVMEVMPRNQANNTDFRAVR